MANGAKGWNILNHRKQIKRNKQEAIERKDRIDEYCGFKKSARLGAKYIGG